MRTYELFKKPIIITGKHAKMVDEMWIRDDYRNTFFKRLIDLYMMAPIIGFRSNHKSEISYLDYPDKTIFAEQVINEKENLEFILQMILVLENKGSKNRLEAIKQGFKIIESEKEYHKMNEIFHSYALGGIEKMYEMLIVYRPEIEEGYDPKASNIVRMLELFKNNVE